MNSLISVCIPAYNRPEVLPDLLNSILCQDFTSFEIVICEDHSPRRSEIAAVVEDFQANYPFRIRYFENEINLGYDANIRNLVEKAAGEYCLFMGNDDLMKAGALATVAAALARYENVGVILRSYAAFDDDPRAINQIFRYFDRELFFPACSDTIVTFFRRSVVISGLVVHRNEARKFATDRFDGTLLYQLHLVANILDKKNGVFLPDILVLYRNGGVPDFGNSEKEQGRFVPQAQTPESSIHFMKGMLEIAASIDQARGGGVYSSILKDIGNYSYPILSIQAKRPVKVFVRYAWGLARLGFWRCKMFYLYFLGLLLLGVPRSDALIGLIKRRLGHTPSIGVVYRGGDR